MTDRRIGIGCLGFLAAAAVFLLFTFIVAMAGGFGYLEVVWRLLTGFASFLRVNLPRISADAGTWSPGLAAFVLALVVGHFLLRGWAKKRNRPWSVGSTLCVGLVLPLLFAISFLVPGVLLQMELLSEMHWFSRERGKAMVVYHMRNLNLAAWSKTSDEPGGKFPDWPEDLTPEELKDWNGLAQTDRENGRPLEPPIYLGRWLTVDSDGSLPLLISPSYSEDGAKVRQVLTMGSEFVEIRDEDVDAWIDKAMTAEKR